MTSFRKVHSGDPLVIPSGTYNAFVDAAQDFIARQQSQSANTRRDGQDVVLVKNSSGSDCIRFGILGISGPLFTPAAALESFKNNLVFDGVTPSAGHVGKFVVLLEPVKAGKIGRACVYGVSPVLLNLTDSTHQYADVTAGQAAFLTSAVTGAAQILWAAGSSGVVWALVRIVGTTGPTSGSVKSLASSGATANTDTWSVTEGTGVRFTATRLYWTGTEVDPILTFTRQTTYDATGRLTAVSAESLSASFATGPCEGS